ncbi:Cupredoxin [Mycena latifolia]|nr:Cupredoxin [Mycena latifolia]
MILATTHDPLQAQVVQVGGPSTGPTIYTPNTITAGNGTVVSFQFTGIPGNHTVTQSSFANPCEPLANGFDSGWVFINDTSATTPVWNLTITDDSKPIWFYCKQIHPAVHCNLGMVGVINVKPGANSLDAFKSAAASASVGEGQNGFSGVGAAATGVPVLGSGATLVGPSATAPAGPGASSPGGGSGTSSSSAPGASKTGSALSTGVSSLTVFFTTLFGMTLVL